MDALVPLLGVFMVFVAFPWIVFHYVTQWKRTGSLTTEDEKLMDELHEMARRLDSRAATIERIMTAENPGWRQMTAEPAGIGIEDNSSIRRIGR